MKRDQCENNIRWKSIEGFEEYSVSENGDVWSNISKRLLKPKKSKTGYLRVCLCANGVHKHMAVHRLVALAFIPNPENKPTVNHINEDKTDNRVVNLEWATNREQNIHGTRIQRAMDNTDWKKRTEKMDYNEIAKKHDYANMNSKQYRAVVQMDKKGNEIASYKSISEAARITLSNAGHLCECCNGRRKTCNGYKWKYKI